MSEIIFEEKFYPCQICGQEKVRKRRDSKTTPKYCDGCRRALKSQQMKITALAARNKIINDKEAIICNSPDGFPVRFKNEEEKKFYEKRFKDYKKDFEFLSSSDFGILSRILLLEIEINRVGKELTTKQSTRKSGTLARLIEEYRRCQEGLGVLRLRRIENTEENTPAEIIQELLEKFRRFKADHPEKFIFKCSKCGAVNELYSLNKENQIENKVI